MAWFAVNALGADMLGALSALAALGKATDDLSSADNATGLLIAAELVALNALGSLMLDSSRADISVLYLPNITKSISKVG